MNQRQQHIMTNPQTIDEAITTRRSVRAFLPTEVPRTTVEDLLNVAARAASGTNIQPWLVHVVTGRTKARLSADILTAFNDPTELAQIGRAHV